MLPDIESRGARLIAISPQEAPELQKLRQRRKLSFPILVDPGNQVAEQFGIRFRVPDDVLSLYQGFGIDLVEANGNDSGTLPMPSRFVVDAGGIVRSVDADPDYTVRPEPSGLFEILDRIQGERA